MSRTLDIGKLSGTRKRFKLPLDLVTQRVALLAKTGAGKSYLMCVMAEEMIAASLPIVVIDPKGEAWGLRSSATGKRDGLDVVIFGGQHGDLPLEEGSGEAIAEWVVEERRATVLDLSDLPSDAAERRFVTAFAKRLYRKNREPLAVFMDEAV